MKLTGCSHELDPTGDEILEAIVTDTRIAIDWGESWEYCQAVMNSNDGRNYQGIYRWPTPGHEGHIEGYCINTTSGEVLLWLKWWSDETGDEGVSLVRLKAE